MKIRKCIDILIYFLLFNYTHQILVYENNITENISLIGNYSFELVIRYNNGKYYIPMSKLDPINIRIESETENLNDYCFKYYFIEDNNKNNNCISYDDNYYNDLNISLIIPEAKYIIVEIKNKINNNKIFLKSKEIYYDKKYSFNTFNNPEKNDPNIILVFSTFCFVTIASILLLIKDCKEDQNIVIKYNLSKKDRARVEYQALKKTFIKKNVFLFALFLMKYTYPIANIFTMYNFNYARYIRLFIELIKILLNYIICILFLKLLIGDNSNYFYYNISFCFSIIASFILYVLTELITRKGLKYDKKRRDIWKQKLESIRKYIYYNIKKDFLFNSKWFIIRNRMISYTRICGKSILRGRPNDKYKIYEDNRNRYNKTLLNQVKSKSSSISLSHSNSFSDKNLSNYRPRSRKSFFSKKNDIILTSRLCIEGRVQSFSISKFGQNNMKLKTVQKFEDIRNNYISSLNESKYDETLEIEIFTKTYNNLEIETLENYTYISSNTIHNQLHNTNYEKNKIFFNVATTVILLLLLALINIGILLLKIFGKIDIFNFNNDKEKSYIFINAVTLQVTLFNLFVNYLFSLSISVFIFNTYGREKKKCFYKMIYKLFVEKYIKYIFRIRLLMNKYSKDLDFIN